MKNFGGGTGMLRYNTAGRSEEGVVFTGNKYSYLFNESRGVKFEIQKQSHAFV